MKYEYNGNLNIEDRIVNVCNDIKECYPNIPIDKLKKIAALETPIIDNIVNNKFKFFLIIYCNFLFSAIAS